MRFQFPKKHNLLGHDGDITNRKFVIDPISVEFKSPEHERGYRRWILPDIRSTLGISIALAVLGNFVFLFVDYTFVGFGPIFYFCLIARALYSIAYIRVLSALFTSDDISRLPRRLMEAFLTVPCLLVMIIYTRPESFFLPIVTAIAVTLLIYIFVPFSLIPTTVILVGSGLVSVALYAFREHMQLPQIIAIALPFVISNVLGFLAGRRFGLTRRREFANSIAERRALRAMRAAKKAAEFANLAKSDFIALISHEIRTPLTSVLGFAQLLADSPLDSSQTEQVRIMLRSGEALTRILTEVLEISQVETGRLQIIEKPFDVINLLTQVSEFLQLRAAGNGMRVLCSHAVGSPTLWLCGDAPRLQQVVSNLVENAVKYAGIGEVRIHLSVIERPDLKDRSSISITISDQGPGIPDNIRERIFEPFFQQRADGAEKGVGLGLFLCQKFVQAMGGTISLFENPGGGAKFAIQLTLPHAEPGDAAQSPLPMANSEASLNILLVDDSELNRFLIATSLTKMGHHVETANNGRDGVDAALARRFDVVLMDIRMPIMDGTDAIRILRDTICPQTDHLPIIALTANVMEKEVASYQEIGANDVISKPVDLRKLNDTVMRVWRESQPANQVAR
jgi:signal transduction histidine kinase/CheY-like chemotaxis protein